MSVTPKPGRSLRDVGGFPAQLIARLRDELSVTTGEEFLDLAGRERTRLRSLLAITDAELEALEASVAEVSGRVDPGGSASPNPPLMTGFDLPPDDEDYQMRKEQQP